jgi:hypothetical protein
LQSKIDFKKVCSIDPSGDNDRDGLWILFLRKGPLAAASRFQERLIAICQLPSTLLRRPFIQFFQLSAFAGAGEVRKAGHSSQAETLHSEETGFRFVGKAEHIG